MFKMLVTIFIISMAIAVFCIAEYIFLIFREWKRRKFQGLKQCIIEVTKEYFN